MALPLRGIFQPARLLVFMCVLGFLIYGDRGVIASSGVNGAAPDPKTGRAGWGIQGEFGIDVAEDGLLPAMLVVGVMLSVSAAAVVKTFSSSHLLAAGAWLFCVGSWACAGAPTFQHLLAARFIVGLGSGPFVALASPLLEDAAPAHRVSIWIALVFVSLTSGFASGFAYGGVAAQAIGWRQVFFIQGLLGLPPALLLTLAEPLSVGDVHRHEPLPMADGRERLGDAPEAPDGAPGARPGVVGAGVGWRGALEALNSSGGDPERLGSWTASCDGVSSASEDRELVAAAAVVGDGLMPMAPAHAHHRQHRRPLPDVQVPPSPAPPPSLWSDVRRLFSRGDLTATMLALGLYVGGIGGFSFYGPQAGREVLGLDSRVADLTFGAATLGAGVIGTLGGGAALDLVGATPSRAILLCITAAALAAAASAASFASVAGLARFATLLSLAEFLTFSIGAPAQRVLLWTSPKELRPMALALAEIFQHVFGDIPAPPLLGKLQESRRDWVLTMEACAGLFLASAVAFAAALLFHDPTGLDLDDDDERDGAATLEPPSPGARGGFGAATAATAGSTGAPSPSKAQRYVSEPDAAEHGSASIGS